MTLKNLIILGGALAGAAYLKDRTRRERFLGQARDFIGKVKSRATEVASEVQAKGSETLDTMSNRVGSDFGSSSAFGRAGHDGSRAYR